MCLLTSLYIYNMLLYFLTLFETECHVLEFTVEELTVS